MNATAFSVTGAALDTRTIPESYVVVREVRPRAVRRAIRGRPGVGGDDRRSSRRIILENDGVLVTGSDVLEAFDRLEVLESTAEAIINCRAVGELRPLSDDVTRGLDEAFFGEC